MPSVTQSNNGGAAALGPALYRLRGIVRLWAIYFIPALLLLLLLLTVLFRVQYDAMWRVIGEEQQADITAKTLRFETSLQIAASDLRYLANSPLVFSIFSERALASEVSRARERDLTAFMQQRPTYESLSFVDGHGRTLWQVVGGNPPYMQTPNTGDAELRIIERLAQRADAPGRLVAAPLEDASAPADAPMRGGFKLRLGTAVPDASDAHVGALVLTARAPFSEQWRYGGLQSGGYTYLARTDGTWLIGPEGATPAANAAADFPGAWQAIAEQRTGQIPTARGLFSYTTLTLTANPSEDGQAEGPIVPSYRLITHVPRAQALAESGTWLVTLVASGVLMSLALLVMSYWTARLTERQQSAKRYLESANEELGERLREAERSHQQTVTLSKLYEDLMTCHDEVEYLTLAERYARQLFAECPGAMLLLHRPKEKLMRPAAPWGCWQEMATDIAEDACWAWRRQDVTTTQSPTDQMCRADGGGLHARPHCCVPLSAGGGRLGVFVLAMPETALRDAARRRLEDLAISFAQRVASGLHSLRLRNELHEQLIRDPLTALFNRRYLRETLATEVARAQRRKTPLSVLMLDIDHFKQLNDTYGHEAGDLVLKTVANSLQRNVRRGDVPCRYGGEEFVIVMPEATEAHAAARAGDLRLQVEQIALTYGGQILRTTISGGIATLSAEMKTEEDLLRAADKALYAAKMNGRNRIFVAEPAGDLHPLDEADQSLGSSSL